MVLKQGSTPYSVTKIETMLKEQIMKLGDLKKGDYFSRIRNGKASEKEYIKGDYMRDEKRYECSSAEWTCSEVYLKKETTIYSREYN